MFPIWFCFGSLDMKNELESADGDRRDKIQKDKSCDTLQDRNLSDISFYFHLFPVRICHIDWQLEIFALIDRLFYRFYPCYDLPRSQNCFQNLKSTVTNGPQIPVRGGLPSESREMVFEVVVEVVLRIFSDFSNSTSIFFDF